MIRATEIHERLAEVLSDEEMAHWCSDLYAKVTPESSKIIQEYQFKHHVQRFTDQITGMPWYDIPFCYNPQMKNNIKEEKYEESN